MSFDFKKAEQALDSLSFPDRLKSVGHLVKYTFTIIGEDEDIIKPWIRMLVYNLVMVSGLFYAWLGWWYDLPLEGWGLLVAAVLFIYKYFYYNKQEMRMSHIVHETIIGNDPSYRSAVAACKPFQPQIRKIAWLDILMAFINKARFAGGGFVMMLVRFFIAGIGEVWDLINHYLLPSVAVDRLDIKPAVQKMKKLKSQVPESLVGVFGIDFLGSVTRQIIIPIYIVLGMVAVALGIGLSDILPSTEIQGSKGPSEYWFTSLQFSWVPVIGALWIGKLFSSLIARTVTGVKVIYFTIFYAKITHPDRIMDSMQEDLVDYLKLKEVD